MTPDDLTPAEREEVQDWYVRRYYARLRRAHHAAVITSPAVRYDMNGRVAKPREPRSNHVSYDRSISYAELQRRRSRDA